MISVKSVAAQKIAAQCANLGLELLGGILDLAEAAGVLDRDSDANRQFLQQFEVAVAEGSPSMRIDRLDDPQTLVPGDQRSHEERPCGDPCLFIGAGIEARVRLRVVYLLRLAA